MFELFIISLLSTILITPFGFLLCKHSNNLINFSNQLIYGIIIISFISLLINFFFPLSILINSFLLILPIFFILKNLNYYFSYIFLKFVFLNAIIIFLLIAKSNIYRPDALLYHLPYTGILNSEKIIFGLSNLHFRFAHVSIIQYFSAFLNNFIFNIQGIVLGTALVASAVIINFLTYLIKYFQNKLFNFHFFFLFFIVIFISYKMNRYGEYGNDAPAHFLFFFLVSEILRLIENKGNQYSSNNFLLSIFITLNKITMGFAIFLPLIFLKKNQIYHFIKIPKNIFAILFISVWIIKNLIVSGCLVYPISKLCFEKLEWNNYDQVKIVSQENEAWSKAWPNYKNKNNLTHSQYIKDFNWIDTWYKTHSKKFITIFLPYILLLICLSLIIYFKFSHKKLYENKFRKEYIFLILIMNIFILIWFLKIPDYRYGYSYLVSLIALIFSYICTSKNNINKKAKSFLFSFLLIFMIVFITKNSLRIINPKDIDHVKFFPRLIFLENDSFKKINLDEFNYIESNNMCGYSLIPCTHYKDLKVKSKIYWKYKVIIFN